MATDNKQVSTWLPPPVYEQMRKAAADDNRTVSMWIRLVVEKELAK